MHFLDGVLPQACCEGPRVLREPRQFASGNGGMIQYSEKMGEIG